MCLFVAYVLRNNVTPLKGGRFRRVRAASGARIDNVKFACACAALVAPVNVNEAKWKLRVGALDGVLPC